MINNQQTTYHASVPADALHDSKISFSAKGVYAYLCSMPCGSLVAMEQIEVHASDDMPAILSSIEELRAAGYIRGSRPSGKKIQCVVVINR